MPEAETFCSRREFHSMSCLQAVDPSCCDRLREIFSNSGIRDAASELGAQRVVEFDRGPCIVTDSDTGPKYPDNSIRTYRWLPTAPLPNRHSALVCPVA